MGRLIVALEANLRSYERQFGVPRSPAPQSTETQQPTPEELYEQLKLPDDVLSGSYANAVMIGHSANEFCFDFITTFFPRSAVSCRVFLTAANVPRFLDSLRHSFDQYKKKLAAQEGSPPTAPEPPEEPAAE
jgi:hypothetical protein